MCEKHIIEHFHGLFQTMPRSSSRKRRSSRSRSGSRSRSTSRCKSRSRSRSGSRSRSKSPKRRSKSMKRKPAKRCRGSKGRFSPCSSAVPDAPGRAPSMRARWGGITHGSAGGYSFAGKKLAACSSFMDAASCGSRPRCSWSDSSKTCRTLVGGAAARRAAAMKLGGPAGAYSPVCASLDNDEGTCSTTMGCKWVGGQVSPRCRPKGAQGFF